MYRVGIIGFGKMGILHGALINGSHKGKLVAICDKSAVMRLGFKRIYRGVKVYKDAKEMLQKENLDIVIVTTPTFNHMESVLMALDKGCHVFVEKPLAINYEQANIIYKKACDTGKVVQVGYCNRFSPTIFKAKQMVDETVVGRPLSIDGKMFIGDVFEEHSGWRYKKSLSGGGAMMDFGIHLLDLMIWFFGDVASVDARAKSLYSKEVEDELKAKIWFKCGVEGNLETSWSKEDYRKSYTHATIKCENGSITFTDQTIEVYDLDNNLLDEYFYPDLYGGCFLDVGGVLYTNQMNDFLCRIEGVTKSHGALPAEAAYVQKVIETLYMSSEKQQICEVQND